MVILLGLLLGIVLAAMVGFSVGVWLTFLQLRHFAPEREGELLTELASLRASHQIVRKASVAHEAMLRVISSEHGDTA